MFGFLKDKLKAAVSKFSKSAEEEVREEKVEDSSILERAKKEEATLVKKAAAKKPAPVKKPEAKPAPAKAVARPSETKKPEAIAKPTPKPTPAKAPEPEKKEIPTTKPEPAKATPKPAPEKTPAPTKKTPVKTEAPRPAPKEEKKPGFFGRLFGKKAEAAIEEKEAEVKEAVIEAEIAHELKAEARLEAGTEAIRHEEEILEEDAEVEEKAIELDETEDEFEAELEMETPAVEEAPAEEPSGFFGKLKDAFTKKTLSDEKFDELFWELELAMLENNVAVEVIEKIKNDLKTELTSGKVSRLGIEDMIATRLRASIEELFTVDPFDLVDRIKTGPRPFKLCIIGVNGSGKTTTLAKLVKRFQDNKLSVVVAASDTFRAAAIDQLKEHTDRLGVKLISQGYNADPAAVAFDAIKHAEAQGVDVVLIDTAGRLHSNTNLMAELEKVVRVAKPDLKIFVGEAITGNDCVEQAKVFNELVGIDAIILSKADIDEKGGAAISVSYVTGKPILYLGTGQTYDDLEEFDKDKIIDAVGL